MSQVKCHKGHVTERTGAKCTVCGDWLPPMNDLDEYPTEDDATITFECKETPETALITLNKKNEILLKWLGDKLKKWATSIDGAKISSKDERTDCSNMLTVARKAQKDVEGKHDDLILGAKQHIKDVKEKFSPLESQLDKGIKSLTFALSKWDIEQDRLAQEAIRKATEAQVDVSTGVITDVVTQPVVLPSKTHKNDLGSDTGTDAFDVIITNADLIPREYCKPHEPLIRAGFKLGKEIPGAIKSPKKNYRTNVKK